MTTIFLIRHAQSEERPKDTAHAPLTPWGEKSAIAIANRLKNVDLDAIYTSSYKRSKDTAKVISRIHKKSTIESRKTLLEVDFRVHKRLSLASFEELQNFYTKTEIEQISNLLKAQKRCMKLLTYFFKRHPDKNIVVTTHGNVIKAMILGVLELKLARFQKFEVSEGSVSIVKGSSLDDAKIVTLNETSHLR